MFYVLINAAMNYTDSFDVIVVGGGHAGTEAALAAARAGASYVSPFIGRLDDIGQDGMDLIGDLSEIFGIYGIETEIIAASVRHTAHILECAKYGADIATVPYKVFKQMVQHPLTDTGIDKFLSDFKEVKTKGDF